MNITALSKKFGKTPLIRTHDTRLLLANSNTAARLDQYDKSPYIGLISYIVYTTAVLGEPCMNLYCNNHCKVLFVGDTETNNELYENLTFHIGQNDKLLSYAHSNLTILDEEECNTSKLEELIESEHFDIVILNGLYAATPCHHETSEEDAISQLIHIAEKHETAILILEYDKLPLIKEEHILYADIHEGKQFSMLKVSSPDILLNYRITEEGTLTLATIGKTPTNDELRSVLKTILTHQTWNPRTLMFESKPMPKYQNEIIRILTTTNICEKIQSAKTAEHLIRTAEELGIIAKTKDKELIASCNTRQMMHNHKANTCNFAYIYIE